MVDPTAAALATEAKATLNSASIRTILDGSLEKKKEEKKKKGKRSRCAPVYKERKTLVRVYIDGTCERITADHRLSALFSPQIFKGREMIEKRPSARAHGQISRVER